MLYIQNGDISRLTIDASEGDKSRKLPKETTSRLLRDVDEGDISNNHESRGYCLAHSAFDYS